MNMQKLPVGIDNFQKLRREDFYYVDKTGLIVELLNGWGEVNLFTRPRRFGKTLNMSMLKAFFEIGGDRDIFEGLAVMQDTELCESYMGRYPVVFLSLKGVDGLTFEVAYERLRNLIRSEALRLDVLRTSKLLSEEERSAYLRIIREKDSFSDIADSLRMLYTLLEKHYGQKVILLLDEYDVPLDKAYWRNTSGNDMVRRLISKGGDGTTQMEIEQLIDGQRISKTLNENLTHNEIDANMENIWSLLYMTGYLTAVDYPKGNRYTLRIPNREVRQIYMDQVLSWFQERTSRQSEGLGALYRAFEEGDVQTIRDFLDEQLLDTVSFYDAQESFYHGFLLALLSTCADWWVSSNEETGKGRSDIIVQRKDRTNGFVVEVKDVKDENKLEAACQQAMQQIAKKDYTALLRRYRLKEIRAYGIAFWDKECRVMMEQIV